MIASVENLAIVWASIDRLWSGLPVRQWDLPTSRGQVERCGYGVDLGHAHVVSRQPRTLPTQDGGDEKPVTESNLSLRDRASSRLR